MGLRSRLAYWLSEDDTDVSFGDVIFVTKLSVRVNKDKFTPTNAQIELGVQKIMCLN